MTIFYDKCPPWPVNDPSLTPLASSIYLIQDSGEGGGIFIKIEEPYKLVNEGVISFGGSHFYIEISGEKVQLRCIEGKSEGKTWNFTGGDGKITVGRSDNCTICPGDFGLSRI